MPNFNVASFGVKAAGGSTVNDWTAANCYPTVAATKAEWTGAVTVVLNDETITETTEIATASFATTTSVAFSARQAGAVWAMNSATLAFINSGSAVVQPVTFSNIQFTRAVPMSAAATYAMLTFTGTGHTTITFTASTFGPVDIDGYLGALVGILATFQGAVAGTVSFVDCVVQGIRHVAAGSGPLFRLGGTLRTYNWTRVAVKHIEYKTGAALTTGWGILPEGAQTFNFMDCSVQDCTVTSANATFHGRAFLYMGSTSPTVKVDGFTFRRITIGSATVPLDGFGWGFYLSGPYSVKRLLSEDCTFHTSNFDGGQLYINGASAIATTNPTDIVARRCVSRSGAALFVSNGAGTGTVFTGVRAYDCTVSIGCIYSGGDGDFNLSGAIVARCISSLIGGSNEGASVYVRQIATAARNKVCNISNLTLIDNVNGASPFKVGGLAIENANAAVFTMTGTVANVISRNSGNSGTTYDLYTGLSDAGTINPTITFLNCNTILGAAGIRLVGTSSASGTTSADPVFRKGRGQFDNEEFELASGSPMRRAGRCYLPGCVAKDARGYRGRVPPDVGGIFNTSGG